MHIRLLTLSDIPAADAILMAAFNATEPRAADLQRYLELQPDGWWVVELDGRLAGMGGAADYGAFAYIGLVAVDPACQRQGIGRALMAHILACIDPRGVPALLDASPMGYPLYLDLGFVETGQAHVYVCTQPPQMTPPPSGISLARPSDLPDLVAFDAPLFGGDRCALLRLLQRDFSQGALVRRDEDGQVSGYLIAKGHRLGPWAARTAQDAEMLLRAALAMPLAGLPLTIVPSQNQDAAGLLERYGFRLVRSLRHMRRGVVGVPERREWVYGQTSFAVG